MEQNNVVKTVLIEENNGVQSHRKGSAESTTSSSRKLREKSNPRALNRGSCYTGGTESHCLSLVAPVAIRNKRTNCPRQAGPTQLRLITGGAAAGAPAPGLRATASPSLPAAGLRSGLRTPR